MSFLSTQAYKGTRDFYPKEMAIRKWMFDKIRKVLDSYAYQEYDGPMLESFEIYAAKSGEEIVNQQLYHFIDRGERKVAIRPEMTPTMARMVAAKIHELPRPIRWYSFPNLWRYERPQKGRLREHWQLNVDVLGGDPVLADVELLQLALQMMKEFGGDKVVSIRVNNRRLMDHLFTHTLGLDADRTLSLTKAIDARAKIGEDAYQEWLSSKVGLSLDHQKKMEDFFSLSFEEVAKKFPCEGIEELKKLFEHLGYPPSVTFDPTIMRGLNYYTGTVFEMFDTSPENRRAMFGGGRYDNLVGLFGKEKLSGVGLGMGDVTLRDFLETHKLIPKELEQSSVDVMVALPDLKYDKVSHEICTRLRAQGLSVMTPLNVDGFGAQLKLALKHQASYIVLFGETEYAQGQVILKDLKVNQQQVVFINEIDKILRSKKNE